ncbi:MAG: NAD-dependent epimerase/dehydratase family protein, partial [Rhodospirillales bacterium]
MNWRGQKVLVTGAGGFIGSLLAEELDRQGADVRAMVLYNSLGNREWLDTSDLVDDMEIFPVD